MATRSLLSSPAVPDPHSSEDAQWSAVLRRDSSADGQFWYAVKSTGIYCRPTCASRRPKRENVVFYHSVADAAQAGFRPCRRCRPDEANSSARHAEIVAHACERIRANDGTLSLAQLAGSVGLSPFHFHRVFKQATGVTPHAFARAQRAARMREALLTRTSVTEAIYDAGFNSNGRFYAESTAMLGMKPSSFRRGGRGESIRFAIGQCSLGAILVAATARGVCMVTLGDEPELLVRNLEKTFPQAQLEPGDAAFEEWMAGIIGWVEAPGIGRDIPLDVRGTAFQQRVWQALQAIPPGSTVSYTDIATRLGVPRAVRAVARACASNLIAVAIPCHRVVRQDGNLSGYRWGVERKRELLRRERATPPDGPVS